MFRFSPSDQQDNERRSTVTISKKHLTIGLVLAVALIAVQWVGAAEGEIIYACVNPAGQVRIVDGPGACRSQETLLQWNVEGPEGPQGPQGPEGPQGPPGCGTPTDPAASQFVMLEIIGVAEGTDFSRILPDATSADIFRVPEGMVFVVTDVDWQYNSGDPGERVTLRLFIERLDDPETYHRVFESTIILNSEGEGGISEAMTTGFAVSSEAKLALDVFGAGGNLEHTIVRGYLIPAGE
jgi:hypothetical protein